MNPKTRKKKASSDQSFDEEINLSFNLKPLESKPNELACLS